MRSVKYLMAAGAASLMSVSAFAADLPTVYPPAYSPPPDNFGGGWYLRGDIGMSNQRVKRLDNVLQTAPNTTTQQIGMGFDSAPTFGVGVGYQFNSWLRADVTGEYRGKASFNGLEIVSVNGTPNGTDEYTAKKSEWLFMGNIYADLGTWRNITPFVGVGVGASRNTISGFMDVNTPNASVAYGSTVSKWQFAWALHAGLAYQASRNMTVELAYRYLDIGNAMTGDLVTYTGVNSVYNPTTFKDITSHDIKLGVRWNLDPVDAPPPPPPLMRKG